MRSAETLRNTIELRATVSEMAAPKPDGWISTPKRQKDDFEALFKRNFKREITIGKIANKSLSQPGCSHSNTIYDVQLQKIYYACSRGTGNRDGATTMRSAETELQNTIELRATVSEMATPKPELDAKAQKINDFAEFFEIIFKRKITSAKVTNIC